MTSEQKTISILGEEVKIGFSMAVEIAYEDITDTEEGFSIKQLTKQKNIVALCMAAIIVFNHETKITMERFMKEITAEEYDAVSTAVVQAMTEWMKIPKTLSSEDQKPDEEQQGEEKPKN